MIENLRLKSILGDFHIENHTIPYHRFMPKFYNFCLLQDMEPGKIVPSRAFCSDESQGFPIILMSKHFGAFPFDHGLVGGVMEHSRHAPHSHHGQDLAILQASHVGYEAETKRYGRYRRLQTNGGDFSSNCGKIHATLEWYLDEYEFAKENTLLQRIKDPKGYQYLITIDKQLFNQDYKEGLFLDLEDLIQHDTNGKIVEPEKILSTSRVYSASKELIELLQELQYQWSEDAQPIDQFLRPSLFEFKHEFSPEDQVESNLYEYLPWIVASDNPMLRAAEINIQIEFDRAYRSIVREESYHERNLIYMAGLNIDYSPLTGEHFPLSEFVPWAAYIQKSNGEHYILEQDALYEALMECSDKNPNQVDLDSMMWDS